MADVTLTEEERLAIQALGVVDLGMDERDLYVAVERIVAARVAAARQAGFQDGCRSTEPSEWVREQIAAAEREALERAVQAIEAVFADPDRIRPQSGPFRTDLANDAEWCARIVRDLMPRKDGE